MMRARAAFVALLVASVVLAGCATEEGSEDEMKEDPEAVQAVPASFREPVPKGTYDFEGPYSKVLVPGPHDILPQGEINVPSDQDGEPIEMALWLPDVPDNVTVPVLLFSSPYFYDEGSLAGSRPVDDPGGSVQALIDNFVPHGYAFATHAVRGTAGSGGCNDLMGPKEVADIDQAVTWLGTQDWSNGNIAMTGVSYDGSTPWSAAATGNPHVKTIIPISGVPDIHGLMYRNGSSETRGPVVLNALYYEIGIASADPADAYERALCPEAYEGIALSAVAGAHGSDPTGYWQERNRKPGVESNYQGSIFSVQGLQDWNVDPSQVIPWVDELNKTGIKAKQLLGQWGHAWPDYTSDDMGPAYRADYKEILLRWLDSELKGKDVDTGPPVQVRDSEGRWRNEEHYPPRDTEWTPLYLSDQMRLVEEDPGSGEIVLPPNVLGSPQVPGEIPVPVGSMSADFTLGPVAKETLVVGLPKVHVTVTPHGPGGYMAAYLYEQTAGGDMNRLGWTTMNLGYAAGGTEYNPVVPGQPLEVKMEVQPMDGVVQEGSSLVLRLWVYTDGDRLPTIPPNGVTLHLGQDSVLKLPTVERGEGYYFEPPLPEEGDDDGGDGLRGSETAGDGEDGVLALPT